MTADDHETWIEGGVVPTLTGFDSGDMRAVTIVAELPVVRRLTPMECERLQGFPDGWTGLGSDSQRYKQMGNAVTVPVIEWLGARLLEIDGMA